MNHIFILYFLIIIFAYLLQAMTMLILDIFKEA